MHDDTSWAAETARFHTWLRLVSARAAAPDDQPTTTTANGSWDRVNFEEVTRPLRMADDDTDGM